MIDENAIGVLVAHYDLESAEYSLGESAYLDYLARFDDTVNRYLVEHPLADEVRRIELGHALYLELADGEQQTDPMTWLRHLRQALVAADLPNVCVLTAGGRWVPALPEEVASEPDSSESDELPSARESGAWRVSTAPSASDSSAQASPSPLREPGAEYVSASTYGPSEPLRKALAAEAFAQPTTSDGQNSGFGPGLYIEKEAIEQLGKNLRNTPTALPVLSATFYRIGA